MRDEIEQNWRLIMHDDEIHELDEVPEMIAEVSIRLIFVRCLTETQPYFNIKLATVCKSFLTYLHVLTHRPVHYVRWTERGP